MAAAKQNNYALDYVQEEFKFLFREEFRDLTLEEIKVKVPELFL